MANKYDVFLNWLESNINMEQVEIPELAREVIDSIKSQSVALNEKPLFTDTGLIILEYLQSQDDKKLKASEIAQGMNISSRTVSGSIRKLVSDNFVQKFGQNPVIYSLTEQGKNFDITSYKENMKNLDNVK